MTTNTIFFNLVPFEVGIIILAGFVMILIQVIGDIKKKNKLCQKCQVEINDHR